MQFIENNLLSGDFCQGNCHAWAKAPNRAMNTKKFISFVQFVGFTQQHDHSARASRDTQG